MDKPIKKDYRAANVSSMNSIIRTQDNYELITTWESMSNIWRPEEVNTKNTKKHD